MVHLKPGGAGRESGRGGDGRRSQLCSGDPHCGWEGTASVAGAWSVEIAQGFGQNRGLESEGLELEF